MTDKNVRNCSQDELKQRSGVINTHNDIQMPKTVTHNGVLYRDDGSVYFRCEMRPLNK